jgi:hypothetical protein
VLPGVNKNDALVFSKHITKDNEARPCDRLGSPPTGKLQVAEREETAFFPPLFLTSSRSSLVSLTIQTPQAATVESGEETWTAESDGSHHMEVSSALEESCFAPFF